jgi:hypothetical protein
VFVRIASLTDPSIYHDDRNIFDNRVKIGSDGSSLGEVGFASTEDEREAYYTTKFEYYESKVQHALGGVAGNGHLGQLDTVPEVVYELWDRHFADEVKAYLLRVLQIPQNCVIETWYSQVDSFQRWAGLVAELPSTFTTEVLREALGSEVPICVEEELRLLNESSHIFSAHAEPLPITQSANMTTAVSTDRLTNLIRRVEDDLVNLLARGSGGYQDALTAIVKAVRDLYDVKVCDFLSVTESLAGLRVLDIFATSVEQAIEQVKSGESAYMLAGGITGSALLLTDSDTTRWILTNVLTADPRQSQRHKDTYMSAYGEVDAFAVFPVFERGQPRGVIRLIEPNDLDYSAEVIRTGRPGTWPMILRLEMSGFCNWLANVLPVLRAAVPGALQESPLAHIAPHAKWLEWASSRFKAAVLQDSVKITNMRDEHRHVAGTLFIGKRESCNNFVQRTRMYPAVPVDRQAGELSKAIELFGRIPPGAGVFVVEEEEGDDLFLPGCRYVSVQATGKLSPALAAKDAADIEHSALVHIDGTSRVIRVYEGGLWSADYFLNEKTGTWQLRVWSSIEAQVIHWLERPESSSLVCTLLRDYVIPYSYAGHGGLILLSSTHPRDLVSREGFRVGSRLVDMTPAQFSTVMAVDGGTWISTDGSVREAGTLYEPESSAEDRSSEESALEGGSRHLTAKGLAEQNLDALVIVISANRPIKLLQGSRGLPI